MSLIDFPVPWGGDLGAMIRDEGRHFQMFGILAAELHGPSVRLVVNLLEFGSESARMRRCMIHCIDERDFVLRPPNPACIEGAPLMEYHEEHALLNESLQYIPGGDGEHYDPPKKFSLLILDQSYVIAERFTIREYQRPSQTG